MPRSGPHDVQGASLWDSSLTSGRAWGRENRLQSALYFLPSNSVAKAKTSSALNKPRSPNDSELEQLANWLRTQGHEETDAFWISRSAYIAVYDDYITGCPGYAGKVMSVVWDGGPSFFDVFAWHDGKIERSGREYDEKTCDRCGKGGTLCVNCWQWWSNRTKYKAA